MTAQQPDGAPAKKVGKGFMLALMIVFAAAIAAVALIVSAGVAPEKSSAGAPLRGSLGKPDRLPRVTAVQPDVAAAHPWSGETVAIVYKDADAKVVGGESVLYVDGVKSDAVGTVQPAAEGKILSFDLGDAAGPGDHDFEVVLVTTAGTQARVGWSYTGN